LIYLNVRKKAALVQGVYAVGGSLLFALGVNVIIVGIQSLFLTLVPIPETPIISDYLTACIIGGIVAGTGTGLIYTTVLAMAIDRVHIQNINTSVMIFTKKTGISQAIMDRTGRGVTNWDGAGAYTNKTSYILMVMISKYEVAQIKQIVHEIDPHAFMIFTEGCSVDGNFEKRL
jgi:uncharacterized membrane-anchored protein YitT (DUF2179 family)